MKNSKKMYKIPYDLHIHSCLSPCGDDNSTPNDIAGLAALLELGAVALTDHNSAKNCPAFFAAAKELGFIPIAGMEVTTEEEIHVLCLFPELENAIEFDKVIYEKLIPIKNDIKIFGNQIIMSENDEITGTVENLLSNATSIDLYSLSQKAHEYDGIIIPAHIEKSSFSLIASLGFVPDDCGFDAVEIRNKEKIPELLEKHPYIKNCNIIHNSDSHVLDTINLPINFIEIEEKNARSVLRAISKNFR